ncbi:hypothetical protein GN958_ATG14891 [Phytophthora infestans]|uniref:Uncharacterized protein n=1 Tax=Phytophthora infestans TaxID=4787 RepID=A0A8S9U4A6_PHYIN|nr:hypothetical protein GN958_ATG14891 [Phytophthora infestans]
MPPPASLCLRLTRMCSGVMVGLAHSALFWALRFIRDSSSDEENTQPNLLLVKEPASTKRAADVAKAAEAKRLPVR